MKWLKRLLRLLLVLTLIGLLAAVAGGFWAWRTLHAPNSAYGGERTVTILPGQSAWSILHLLQDEDLLPDARLARAFLAYRLDDAPLKAGEYLFDQPLATPQVLEKLIRGQVISHPVTLIEGLDLEEIAAHLANSGFGDEARFRQEMSNISLIADLDPLAENLEGYLYPDTYNFARGTSEAAIVAKLVRTFRQRFDKEVRPLLDDRLTMRELLTLASIIEKEAAVDEERVIIAGVYSNRLRKGIALYADPTVIYAKKLRGDWDGNLRRPDLAMDSPYNTYRYPGLPPGPICSAGVASILAAAAPADVPYLYFVSRNDGTHVFSTSLREHQRNVNQWQRRYWRKRWAEEARKSRSQPSPD
jgi:UPF0755 protein